jgi:signal transduction histidine kinase
MQSHTEHRLRRLLEAGRSLTSELDLDEVLDRILVVARELTGAGYAAIGVLDERRRELAEFLTSGIAPQTHAAIGDLPRGRGLLGVLIAEPQPIRLHDVAEHPRSYGFPPGHPPMRSFLGVPILIRGEAWGNVYLTEKAGGVDFDDDDLRDVVALAGWAAIAIDNARLYRASEQRRVELERAVGGIQASMDIAVAVGGETDLERVLELIVKRARALVDADALLIWLREGDELRLAAHAGNGNPSDGMVMPFAGSSSGNAFAGGQTQRVDDVRELGIPPAAYGLPDASSALIVPLLFRGQGVGVLVAFDHLGDHATFDVDDERALQSFAASAATAVATARTVSEQRLRDSLAAAEAERKRWARELHDETLQGLGALKLALSVARRAEPEQAREVLDGAIVQLDQEIAALRAIVADLRPAALDELGLGPAMRSLALQVAGRSGLDVQTSVDLEDTRLPAETETVAYRIAQEALTNVVKHAEARSVRLDAALRDGILAVRVSDDGRGLEAHRPSRRAGFGLIGMRERAELAGGRLTVESGEHGTTVELVLPVA